MFFLGAEPSSDIKVFNVTLMKPQFYGKFILNKGHSVYKVGGKNTPINIYKTIFTIKSTLLHA